MLINLGFSIARPLTQKARPDFLRDRTLDLAHAIPEPDYFPLLLDIHLVTSED